MNIIIWLLIFWVIGIMAVMADLYERHKNVDVDDLFSACAWPWRLIKPLVLYIKQRRSK